MQPADEAEDEDIPIKMPVGYKTIRRVMVVVVVVVVVAAVMVVVWHLLHVC